MEKVDIKDGPAIITITQSDIENGIPHHTQHHPFSLALKRQIKNASLVGTYSSRVSVIPGGYCIWFGSDDGLCQYIGNFRKSTLSGEIHPDRKPSLPIRIKITPNHKYNDDYYKASLEEVLITDIQRHNANKIIQEARFFLDDEENWTQTKGRYLGTLKRDIVEALSHNSIKLAKAAHVAKIIVSDTLAKTSKGQKILQTSDTYLDPEAFLNIFNDLPETKHTDILQLLDSAIFNNRRILVPKEN